MLLKMVKRVSDVFFSLNVMIDLGERLKQPDKCPNKIYSLMTKCWELNPNDRPNFEKLVELLKKEKSLF